MSIKYEKECKKCGKVKYLFDFQKEGKGKLGRKAKCKTCTSHFKGGTSNVLAIPDIHEPFVKDGFLSFCKSVYKKYKCNKVVFIGDVIDNHAAAFWASDPDGDAAGAELDRAIAGIAKWYKEFPIATVTLGNHDLRVARKMLDAGLSKRWMKSYAEVLGTPGWDFVDSYELNDVLYTHGGTGKAAQRSRKELISMVQGHYHPEAYIIYSVGRNYKIFGMQVGSGIDDKAYAMAYGKHHPKSAISCGVILDNGKLPILEMMEL